MKHLRLHLVPFALAVLLIAGCGVEESDMRSPNTKENEAKADADWAAAHSTVPTAVAAVIDRPCDIWNVADGSTFERSGMGNPTMINPKTGTPSTPFFRNCGRHLQIVYLELPVRELR